MVSYTDILLDNDGDLFAEDGKAIGECKWQDVQQLLMLTKGGLSFAPLIGTNIHDFTEGSNVAELKKRIRISLRYAGIELTVNELQNLFDKLPK